MAAAFAVFAFRGGKRPARKFSIPGFDRIKKAVMAAGANGFTISGAGPSVIAFSSDDGNLEEICSAMEKGFLSVPNACMQT